MIQFPNLDGGYSWQGFWQIRSIHVLYVEMIVLQNNVYPSHLVTQADTVLTVIGR